MSDDQGRAKQRTSTEVAVQATTTTITGVVGAVHPVAGIAAAAVKEFADPHLVRLFEKVRQDRGERSARVLTTGADEANVSLDRLVHTIESSPDLLALMAETVEAAANTPLDAKVIALGRCLGRGVRDDTAVDAERLRVRGLAGIEGPEVKLMELLDTGTHPMREDGSLWPGWRRPEILDSLPGFASSLDASIARLTAEGLVVDDGIGRFPGDDGYREMWILTSFGKDCLALLRAVAPTPS
ncbi:hypothetical protein ACFVQ9_10920 [Streptomyces goshikiensis]|uniref:hypothetical protein n=1 Tax=Streptomyces goshikiensis TaxID=1942 RepID=UPI0036B52013